MPSIFEKRFWLYSALAMIVIGPVTVWGAWDTISDFHNLWLRIGACVCVVLLEYIGGVLLLWWSAVAQNYWDNKSKNQK